MSDRPAETEFNALQALLQIRSNTTSNNSGQSQDENRTATENTKSEGAPNPTQAAAAAAVAAANTNANISNFLRMSANPAFHLQQAQLSFASGQLAAAAASLQQNQPTMNGNFGGRNLLSAVLQNPSYSSNSTSMQGNAFMNSIAQGSSSLAASAPMDVSQRSAATAGLNTATTANTSGEQTQKTQVESENIRKGEVEAALRSKPQRGRKRENLNAEERLELTRTRNREHAKSTRIRKKARYQELLDREQQFLVHQHAEELGQKRRQAVHAFLHVRALMLHSALQLPLKAASDNPPSSNPPSDRSVSFDHTDKTASGKAHPDQANFMKAKRKATFESIHSKLSELVENKERFRFETPFCNIDTQGLPAMDLFDDDLGRRIGDQFREISSKEIFYRVVGSDNGVALSQDNSGFAKVELVAVMAPENDPAGARSEKLLSTSVVSFQFAADSPKLSQVSWGNLKEITGTSQFCGANDGNKSDSTARESLESQNVYPSVVSFDETHRGKVKDCLQSHDRSVDQEQGSEQVENPGMSI